MVGAEHRVNSEQDWLVELDIVHAGVLVAELGFDPEHAEIIAADDVGIETGFIIDIRGIFVMS